MHRIIEILIAPFKFIYYTLYIIIIEPIQDERQLKKDWESYDSKYSNHDILRAFDWDAAERLSKFKMPWKEVKELRKQGIVDNKWIRDIISQPDREFQRRFWGDPKIRRIFDNEGKTPAYWKNLIDEHRRLRKTNKWGKMK